MKTKSVKFNFIMNFILTISGFVFPLITFPYISRILLVEGTGKIAFASSVINYFMMIASLGIPTYGIRECAKIRDDKNKLSKLVQELIIIHSIITIISLIFLFVSIQTVPQFEQEKSLLLINGFQLILNVIGVNWLYSALEQYEYITIRSILFKIVSIILMFLFVRSKNDYIIYAGISVLAAAGSNILNFYYLRKFIILKPFKEYEFKKHLKPILIFFAQSVAITIYTNLDTVMLGLMKGNIEVGYYNAAIKIRGILVGLVTSLGNVLLPRLSYYIENKNKKEFNLLLRKAYNFILVISIPLTIFSIIGAKECIVFLSGDDFSNATLAMQLINPTIILVGLSTLTGTQIMIPLGLEKKSLYSFIVGAIIDLLVNFNLIPILGAAGASLGTTIAELFVLIVQVYFIKNIFLEIIIDTQYFKLLLASALSIITFYSFKQFQYPNLFYEIFILGVSFFSVYGAILLITKETITYYYTNQIYNKVKEGIKKYAKK